MSVNMRINDFLRGLAGSRAAAGERRDALYVAARRFTALVAGGSNGNITAVPSRVSLQMESGLHRGATLELTAAEYLVGSGDDCDIVLRDSGVAPRQCRLVREAGGFALFDAGSETSQPAKPRTVQREADSIRTCYEVGGVRIALTSHAPRHEAEAALAAQSPQPRSPARIFGKAIAAGLALTAIALGAVHLLATGTAPDLAQRIIAGGRALAAQGFDTVRFQRGPSGELVVAGLVEDAQEQTRLRGWLARSRYGDARFTVQAAAGLVEQVRDTFAGEDLQIDFREGRLRIEGTTRQLEVKRRVRTLAEELQGVVAVEDRVAYSDARQRDDGPGPLPVRIRDVMIGAPSYFRTETGERYFEGALLPDGAEVLAIEPRQIRFRLAEKIVVYPLEG